MCKRIFANQTSEVGEVPFYKIGTLGGIPDAYISKKLFDEYKQNYRFPKPGETLISCSGTIGRCIQYDGKDAYFQDSNIVWLVNNQTKIINEFLFCLISRYDWSFLNVSTIKRLFTKDLNNLKLYYPKDQREQKSISNFIAILNSRIKNIENKINVLKKYKKGMQKNIFDSSKTNEYLILKNIVKFENKSKIPANSSIENGNYVLYKSGQKNGTINVYSHEGIYIIANDGGIAQFKLASDKFAYTDHCICFRCQSDEETIVLCNYLQSLEKKITYVGFTGTGLKNIDRQYLCMIRIPKVDNKKIAKSFNLIDEAIRNYENILEKITIIKKLLLKQMFI